MLDAGVIWPSNSPWCNAVVLARKKDGSLRFCIDFRKLNSLTVKDSHPLPHICETLESLAGATNYSTFDMNSGFWQVPMDEESKQYTAFTLGSMGLYECESMPFGLCNAPPTCQRLMLNCLGKLNLKRRVRKCRRRMMLTRRRGRWMSVYCHPSWRIMNVGRWRDEGTQTPKHHLAMRCRVGARPNWRESREDSHGSGRPLWTMSSPSPSTIHGPNLTIPPYARLWQRTS